MKFINSYLDTLQGEDLKKSIRETTGKFLLNEFSNFNFKSHVTGLLLGEVQSGKTGQILGIVSTAADFNFDIFLFLTTDNVRLQTQTFSRCLDSLTEFCVCNDKDDLRFLKNKMRKPVIIVLHKNSKILDRWQKNISNSAFMSSGRAIFIVDDEGDAASLNTKVNKKEQSSINKCLDRMKNIATSSFYLQVTATPQSILLQTIKSGWRPEFVYYFKPGKEYLGGDFFYSDPRSFAIKIIEDDDINKILEEEEYFPIGLINSLVSFLITSAHLFVNEESDVCNFLIHPSVSTESHFSVARKIGEMLNHLLILLSEKRLTNELKGTWEDLQSTKPDLISYNDTLKFIHEKLSSKEINIIILNSKSQKQENYEKGINIVIGGNTLSRGVTFQGLQTVYYTRSSKTPNADTFWQHCRMFGYDRDPALMRVFIPEGLQNLFENIHQSHKALIEHILHKKLDDITLLYPDSINPTRKTVIDAESLIQTVGGVNYFARSPSSENISELDALLLSFVENDYYNVHIDELLKIIVYLKSNDNASWDGAHYSSCIESIKKCYETNPVNCILLVRTNRKITKGTGTMLSEKDRKLCDNFKDQIVLVVYKMAPDKSLDWGGQELWMPNIKFPDGFIFYKNI